MWYFEPADGSKIQQEFPFQHPLKTSFNPVCSSKMKSNTQCFSHRKQLLKGKLETFSVVCDSFGCDVLNGVFQQLFISHVGLNQMVEARRFLHPGVKLGDEKLWPANYSSDYGRHACGTNINAVHSRTPALPPGLGCYQEVVNRHIHQTPLIASHPWSSTIWYPWKLDSALKKMRRGRNTIFLLKVRPPH